MKRVVFHGVLALLGLGLAWQASRPTEESSAAPGERLFACAPDHVTRLQWHPPHESVEIVPASGEGATGYRVTHTTEPPEGEPVVKHFRGLTAVAELLGQLAPLGATRDLGDVADTQLGELGLDHEAAQLTLTCGARTQVFAVGKSAYGSGMRYLRRAEGGHVYLVSADPFRALGMADGRLMQRDLHGFESTEVAKVDVTAYGQARTLLQRGRQNPRMASWVANDDAGHVNELFGNWLRDVDRLRAERYLDEGVEPGAEPGAATPSTPQPIARLRYVDAEGHELGHMELVLVEGTPEHFFARSEATGTWVEVPASVGVSVARDAATVVGSSAAPTPPSAATATPTE